MIQAAILFDKWWLSTRARSRCGPITPIRTARLSLHVLILVAMATAACPPAPAQATETSREKTALKMLEVAKFYYHKGKFLKAAKGFHDAYAIDPRPEFLFNAARAEHLGMALDKAAKNYQKCLALKTANAKLNGRARLYLGQVKATMAMIAKAREEGQQSAGNKTGRQMPPKALKTEEKRLEGMSMVRAANPGPGATEMAKGVTATVSEGDGGGRWRGPVGWGGMTLGVIAVGVSGWLYKGYQDDQDHLNDLTAIKDADGKKIGIGSIEARKRQEDLNTRATTAVTGLVVGGLVGGLGAVILLTGPDDKVAWSAWPGGRGFNVELRF